MSNADGSTGLEDGGERQKDAEQRKTSGEILRMRTKAQKG